MARPRPLQCPFCDNYLARPVDIKFKSMEFTGGICQCHAVYLYDRSARNLGETLMDALTFLCRDDIDKALSLAPEDYETIDLDYSFSRNTTGGRSGSEKSGKLLFARLLIEDEEK
jgi:hypothetical protein